MHQLNAINPNQRQLNRLQAESTKWYSIDTKNDPNKAARSKDTQSQMLNHIEIRNCKQISTTSTTGVYTGKEGTTWPTQLIQYTTEAPQRLEKYPNNTANWMNMHWVSNSVKIRSRGTIQKLTKQNSSDTSRDPNRAMNSTNWSKWNSTNVTNWTFNYPLQATKP